MLNNSIQQTETWMEEIWKWADENDLSEQDIPRNANDLINLQKFSSVVYESDSSRIFRYINPLPKAFSNLKKLKYLDLSNSDLKSVPAFLMNLNELETLKLNDNKISILPKSINKLKGLKYLDVSTNIKIKSLPESISELENLEHLNLKNNYNLKKLPDLIGNLENLNLLHYSSNSIEILPQSINHLKNLTSIEIGSYSKDTFPDFILNQKKLLNLAFYITFFDTFNIPNTLEIVTQFQYLERLRLSGLDIKTIPDNFKDLKNIKYLDLDSNYNMKINNSLFDLPSLEYLNLRNCNLKKLSKNIENLTNLKSLNLECNELIELPSNIGNLQLLEKLDIYNNKIKYLPENIGSLKNLVDLIITDNKLKCLPDSISSLSNLSYLDCSYNKLTTLPDSIGLMSNLKKLDCSYNELTTLPDSISSLSNLSHLNCRSNKLTTLPDSISKLCLIEKIYIDDNPITTLPNSMNEINSLKEFWIPVYDNALSSQVLNVLSQMSNVSIIGLNENLEMVDNNDGKNNVVTIQISGTGVETFGGTVDFKTYQYFEDNGIDLNEYSHDVTFDLDELNIPDEHNFGGMGLEQTDDLWHINGAYLDIDDNEIEVIDGNNSRIWQSFLSSKDLKDQGVKIICDGDFDEIVNELPTPLAVIAGRYVSNGVIFKTKIKLTEKFDASKLVIYYHEDDGIDVIKMIKYDGKTIEDESSSSYGQRQELSWFVII